MNLGDMYARLFSRGILAKLNYGILYYALRARGYNNFKNNNQSGESFFIREVLSKENPKLCIDVGANVGGYTCDILEQTSAKVISFEPLPIAFEKLKLATERFSDRVILENKGVGSSNADLTINYNPEALEHASFSEEVKKVSYVTNEEKVTVPVVTLDSYCSLHDIKEIDFIKIDTEGFESEVFDGARRCFEEIRPKYIQIEFNWHQLFRNTSLNYFSEKLPGYDVYQLLPNSWIKRDPGDPFANVYHYSNFIFVRQD